MKTLDKPLYVHIPNTGLYGRDYLNYSVEIKPATQAYGAYSSDEGYETIFNGRIYLGEYRNEYVVYLNDVIEPHVNHRSHMSMNHDAPGSPLPGTEENINDILVWVRVKYMDNNAENFRYIEDEAGVPQAVFAGYLRPMDKLRRNIVLNEGGTGVEQDSFLSLSTRIIPRVPRLPYSTENFWTVFTGWTSQDFYYDSELDGDPVIGVTAGKDQRSTIDDKIYDMDDSCFAQTIYGDTYFELTHDDPTATEIMVEGLYYNSGDEIDSFGTKVYMAIDDCPAEYYLIWVDRFGGYQCQPFSKREVTTEDITTGNLVDLHDYTRPYLKSVSTSFKLNSDWIDEEHYKAYESIFVSPSLYLFNTKTDTGCWVNCEEKKWEEKNKQNSKRLFNLSITLKTNRVQNIIY